MLGLTNVQKRKGVMFGCLMELTAYHPTFLHGVNRLRGLLLGLKAKSESQTLLVASRDVLISFRGIAVITEIGRY